MVNRRELIVGAAALGVSAAGGMVSAKASAPEKVIDILLYGIKRTQISLNHIQHLEFEMVECTEPRLAAGWPPVDPYNLARDLFRASLHGLMKCEADRIEPLGFVLSDRAFANLWYPYLDRINRYSLTKQQYTLLGHPVVLLCDGGREGD